MSIESEKYKSLKTIRNIWNGMKRRCYDTKDKAFHNYGGRGIKVCDRWHVFENFYNDLGKNRPSAHHSMERINNDMGYSLDNCKWATIREQNRNMRINVMIEYKGKKQLLIDWSRELKISVTTMHERIKRGWSIEESFETPVGVGIKAYARYKKIIFNGQEKSLSEWSKETGLSVPAIKNRLKNNQAPDVIFGKPQKLRRMYLYNGKKYTATELSKLSGFSVYDIHRRINKFKWSVEEAVTIPIKSRVRKGLKCRLIQ
jgi:hypothetical protein